MRISLKTLLMSLFAVLTMMAIGQGIFGILKTKNLYDGIKNNTENWLPSVDSVNKINTITGDYRVAQFALATAKDNPAALKAAFADFGEQVTKLTAARKTYEPLISSTEERATYNEFSQTWGKYEERGRIVREAAERGDASQALIVLQGVDARTSIRQFVYSSG